MQEFGTSVRLAVLDVGSLDLSVRLAPRVESFGYGRYWISEHHGEGAIPNPLVLLPAVAGATETIRVGTAAVLLRFQSPLAVAESFRSLDRLFPGRIDAGVGRGSTKPALATALGDGRSATYTSVDHEARVREVQRLLHGRLLADHPLVDERIDPPLIPTGSPPLWVTSSLADGATLAAAIGASYAFHDHFNWQAGAAAVRRYVAEFQPSPELAHPTWNVTVAGYCTEDAAEATSVKARWFDRHGSERRAFVGPMSYWRDRLGAVIESYRADEIVIQTLNGKYDLDRQVESFARIAEVARALRRDAGHDPGHVAAATKFAETSDSIA